MHETSERRFKAMNLLLGAASALIVFYGIKELKSILIPFAFAILFGIICGGLVEWFRSRKLSYFWSVVASILLLGAILSCIVFLLYLSLQEMAQIAEESKNALGTIIDQGWQKIEHVIEYYFPSLHIEEKSGAQRLDQSLDILLNVTSNLFKILLQSSQTFGIALVFSFFILLELPHFEDKVHLAFHKTITTGKLVAIVSDIQSYLQVKTLTSLLTGCMIAISLWFLGVKLAILWGILAFTLNYIPFVGSIIAAIPAIVFSLLNIPSQGITITFIVIITYVFTNILVSNFIEPTLMSNSLGLSPIIVFGSLVFWGFLWGPAGMLLSVPFTMMLKIIFENSEDLTWIAIMISNRDSLPSLQEQDEQPTK